MNIELDPQPLVPSQVRPEHLIRVYRDHRSGRRFVYTERGDLIWLDPEVSDVPRQGRINSGILRSFVNFVRLAR